METLILSKNQLTTLPPSVSELTALKELNLLDNRLTALPKELAKCTAVETLLLNGNSGLTNAPAESKLWNKKEVQRALSHVSRGHRWCGCFWIPCGGARSRVAPE